MGDEETQEVADAHETIGLVHTVALDVAQRAIAHVRAHEHKGIAAAVVEERLDGAGYVWVVKATWMKGRPMVNVEATAQPAPDAPPLVSPQVFARIMGNSQAGFDILVPVPWIEAAAERSLPELIAEESVR